MIEQENRCWDCIGRTGWSAIKGRVAVKFWGRNGNLIGSNRIEEQRQGCPGSVAALLQHAISGEVAEEDGAFTLKSEVHDLYEAVCPKDNPTLITAHEEVTAIMRQNNLVFYHHNYVELGSTVSAEEMQQRNAQIISKLDAARANRSI
jgi:hypothetical protein